MISYLMVQEVLDVQYYEPWTNPEFGKTDTGAALVPLPRNFTCGTMMREIPDGQLFWIIKNGSMGTGMMAFSGLSDDQVWQLIHHIRSLAK